MLSAELLLTCVITDKLETICLLATNDYLDMVEGTSIETFVPQVEVQTASNLLASSDIIKLHADGVNNISDVSSAFKLKILNTTPEESYYEKQHLHRLKPLSNQLKPS